MGAISFLRDRLTNVMSGMGTSIDRRGASQYLFMPLTGEQAEAAYRTSWLARKIVDIPPKDMTRAWRDWQTSKDIIQQLEAEEKRLGLKAKCQRALVLSRLFGGGALILGTNDPDPAAPLAPERIRKGGLTYIHVMSRHQLSEGQERRDPTDPWFGQPEYFQMNAANRQGVKLHPSRVVAFVGQKSPEGGFYSNASWFWGDPIMQSIGDAVKNADTAQSGFAALIDDAAVDIIGIPDLMSQVGTDEYQSRLMNRLSAAKMGASTWRMKIRDAAETWETKQISWAGIPDVMTSFLNVVAGAADIPVTRLLGQSPKGLQSTGDGEERDYHSKVKADQGELLVPALDRVDELLIPSALGSRPDDIYYEFAPLGEPDPKQAADIEKVKADTIKVYSDTGHLPDIALAAIAKNAIIEGGQWPGSEAAFEEAELASPDQTADPASEESAKTDLRTRGENVVELKRRGAVNDSQAALLIADAAPRTLYVQRKLLNAAELIRWAKGQGFETTTPAADMHATVLFSRTPVDWMKMGSGWDQDAEGHLTVQAGGARLVEPLGDKGAVVLLFSSSALAWRHEEMVRNGASHDFENYQPHVTITYETPVGLDLAKVEPFRGKLVFGPEIFSEVDDDWKPRLAEDGGERQAGAPFEDAYRPEQPRDWRGRWASGAALTFISNANLPTARGIHDLGAVDESVTAQLQAWGIKPKIRHVVLEQGLVRHILNRHGPKSNDRNALSHADIAMAHHILHVGVISKGTPFEHSRGRRIVARADVAGQRFKAVYAVGRDRITLMSMARDVRK